MDYPFASCHKGPEFKYPGGYLCNTGILLLALSRYTLFFTRVVPIYKLLVSQVNLKNNAYTIDWFSTLPHHL